MTKYIILILLAGFTLNSMAFEASKYQGECDRAYGDCPGKGGETPTTPGDNDGGSGGSYRNWVCYADNLIVKGFIGESSDPSEATSIALAKCEASSQLPCFPITCRGE